MAYNTGGQFEARKPITQENHTQQNNYSTHFWRERERENLNKINIFSLIIMHIAANVVKSEVHY